MSILRECRSVLKVAVPISSTHSSAHGTKLESRLTRDKEGRALAAGYGEFNVETFRTAPWHGRHESDFPHQRLKGTLGSFISGSDAGMDLAHSNR